MRSLELIDNLRNRMDAIIADLEDYSAIQFIKLEHYRFAGSRYIFKRWRISRLEKSMILMGGELAVWRQAKEDLLMVAIMINEEKDIVGALATLDEAGRTISAKAPLKRSMSAIEDIRKIFDCFMTGREHADIPLLAGKNGERMPDRKKN